MTVETKTLRVGHSPDADDAFMFYALARDAVTIDGYRVEHVMEDIESLNQRALRSELEVTAISAHTFPYVQDHYWIMRSGASMGVNYGPVLVAREPVTLDQLAGKTVATPGARTTASLLLAIFSDGKVEHRDMDFDQIISAVQTGRVDAGLIIHEGQVTYQQEGLHKVLDLGEAWYERTGRLPLPLGLDMVRKDLGRELAGRISAAIRESIQYGYDNLDAAIEYALQFGRGLGAELGEKFVKMYVNELTIDMGESGRKALETLFQWGAERGLTPQVSSFELV